MTEPEPVRCLILMEKINWEIFKNNDNFHTYKALISQMDDNSEKLDWMNLTTRLLMVRTCGEWCLATVRGSDHLSVLCGLTNITNDITSFYI